jgi:hypothetical protein
MYVVEKNTLRLKGTMSGENPNVISWIYSFGDEIANYPKIDSDEFRRMYSIVDDVYVERFINNLINQINGYSGVEVFVLGISNIGGSIYFEARVNKTLTLDEKTKLNNLGIMIT